MSRRTLPVLMLLMALALPAAADRTQLPGFVDGSDFLELVTEDTTSIEVNLHGPILKAIVSVDEDLKRLAGGLESIHAVILEFDEKGSAARGLELMRSTEKKLVDRKWQVLTRIRDGQDSVVVMALSDDETIQGLVVLVAEGDGRGVVFANLAGVIDLAAIAQLGESFDIPGLDQIGK